MERSGFSQILNAKSMEMNVSAMPPRAESNAALGATRLIHPPTSEPTVSITPLTKQAASPAFHAASALPVLSFTGSMTKKMNAKSVTVLRP